MANMDDNQYAMEAASVRSTSSQRMGTPTPTTENNPHANAMGKVQNRSSQRMGMRPMRPRRVTGNV